jgi:arylsulfatase A
MKRTSLCIAAFALATTASVAFAAESKPNIILILADDLGYGDVRCNNPAGKIPTPNIDRLAREGLRFTDAHAPSAVCTPTRYSILTGRYCWRTRLTRGVLHPWDPPLIEADRLTLAALLRTAGYRTACLGKWHLGMNWPFASEAARRRLTPFSKQSEAALDDFDWSKPIAGGPITRGFDSYFGVNCPNFAPYAFIENDHLVGPAPDHEVEALGGRLSRYAGPAQRGFDRRKIVPTLMQKAVELIADTAKTPQQPLFLYFAMTGPHSPIIPNDAFKGRSGIGDYGDFVTEMDWTVGEILRALDRHGMADNTLVIFTSDNGPEAWNYEEARKFKHYAMGSLRGVKRDLWEGGHRVAFLARWPKKTPAGAVSEELICHVDLMATCAALVGAKLPDGAAEDSVSVLPALLGEKRPKPLRDALVLHAYSGALALRKDNWIFIDAKTGMVSKEPQWFQEERGYQPHSFPGELYDLRADLSERFNLYGQRPEVVRELRALLEKCKRDGRSTPED